MTFYDSLTYKSKIVAELYFLSPFKPDFGLILNE